MILRFVTGTGNTEISLNQGGKIVTFDSENETFDSTIITFDNG